MKVAVVAERVREVVATLGRIVVGKDDVLERILAGILANGHVLIEDYPGLAKTLIARLLAQALDLGFRRIQFTPDLLPSDITGSFLYDQRESRFEFRAGPVFTNLLLADEINRATPKTQAALLEAMQEAPGHDRGPVVPARAAVRRDRDPEPDRDGGHLPAARGPARPVPAARGRRVPGGGRRARDPEAPARAPHRRRRRADHRDARRAPRHAGRARGRLRERGARALHRGARPGHADRPARDAGGLAARAAWPCSSSRGRRRPSAGATSCCPTT